MIISVLAAAVSIMAASDATTPPGSVKAADDQDKVVCRMEADTSGNTRFKKRICLTKGQWDEQERQSENVVNQAQRNAGLVTSQGGGMSGH